MKNILVVDDNKLIAEGLALRLAVLMRDVRIHTAENGREALTLLESTSIDFVMTDLQMPVMSGFELIDYCRKNKPGIPLYAMTGDTAPEVTERLSRAGVSAPVEKPFDFDEVAERIKDALFPRMRLSELFS